MTDFSGKVALVTGGGSGIGRALAEELARAGSLVAITDVNLAGAEAAAQAIVAAGGTARAMALDVTSDDQWGEVTTRIENEMGPIDILCSNAGACGSGKELIETPMDFFKWLFDVNVFSAARAIKAVVPGMKQRKGGYVLFTGSVTSTWTDVTDADYAATKHAVLAIADTLRQEVAGSNIAISLLCPGPVRTGILENSHTLAEASLDNAPPARDLTDPALIARHRDAPPPLAPEDVARLALEGLVAGRFFIFTQPDTVGRAISRNAELDSDLAAAR